MDKEKDNISNDYWLLICKRTRQFSLTNVQCVFDSCNAGFDVKLFCLGA